MDKLIQQMKEYLSMDSEIPYAEMAAYYEELVAFLNDNYQSLNVEDTHKARYLAVIVESNCTERAKRKNPYMKKYKKMGQRMKVWSDALTYNLRKAGVNDREINEVYLKINDEM